jgi:alpha-beta hydrolase superfamily lysophospholipase
MRSFLAKFVCLLAFLFVVSCHCQTVSAEVIRQDQNFLSLQLGIPVYIWTDTQNRPGTIVIALQGAVLHGRAYDTIARKLAGEGVMVVAPDFRGFGAWYYGLNGFPQNRKIDLKKTEADLKEIYDKLEDTYHLPIVWMGESFGANCALRMSTKKGGGLILASYAPKQRLFFQPRMVGHGLLWFTNPRRNMNISPYLKSRISESPHIAKEMRDDPLNRFIFRAGELYSMAKFTGDGIRMAKKLDPDTPVLFIHGKQDRLIRADDVEKFYANLKCNDKHMLMLENSGHMHLEVANPDPKVVEAVTDWTIDHTQPTAIVKTNRTGETIQ